MTTNQQDPFTIHIEEMIEQYEPHEIHAALVAIINSSCILNPTVSIVDISIIERIDLYLEQWTLTTLLRQHDTEGLEEMQRLCNQSIALLEQIDQQRIHHLRGRWKGFEALLEGKRLQQNHIGSCDYVFAKTATTITKLIKSSDIRQSELALKLGVSARRINTIVGTMEDRGQLIRYRDRGET